MLQQLAATLAAASVLLRMAFADEVVLSGSEPTKKCLINYLADSRKATFESCNCVSALDSCQSQVTSLETQLAGFSALSSELCQTQMASSLAQLERLHEAEVSALEAQVANLQANAARTAAIVYEEGAGSKAWSTITPDEAYDDLVSFAQEAFGDAIIDYFIYNFNTAESIHGLSSMRVENDADLASAFAITSVLGTVPAIQSIIAYRHLAETGSCCVNGSFHRRCYSPNKSQSECMQKCDEDDNCKGFVMHNGGNCYLATISACPAGVWYGPSWTSNVGELDLNGTCGSGYLGCFVKRP